MICTDESYMGENARFPGNQSSLRKAKSIVKMVLLSICRSPSISGNINLGSCYHGSMDHGIWSIQVPFPTTSPKIHSCHFSNIVKVSPKSISISSIRSNEEINKLTLFWYWFCDTENPESTWETSQCDSDCPLTLKTDKIIISWHWWELYLQMAWFFCPFYLN